MIVQHKTKYKQSHCIKILLSVSWHLNFFKHKPKKKAITEVCASLYTLYPYPHHRERARWERNSHTTSKDAFESYCGIKRKKHAKALYTNYQKWEMWQSFLEHRTKQKIRIREKKKEEHIEEPKTHVSNLWPVKNWGLNCLWQI